MLKELYHGKISPSEKKPGHADSQTQKWMKLSAEFEKTLTFFFCIGLFIHVDKKQEVLPMMLFLLGIPGIQLCDERTADVVPYAEGGAGYMMAPARRRQQG